MQNKQIKILPIPHLSEIFQSVDVKFSFVNDDMEQVSVPAKCRDFLGDCLWSKVKGKSVNIYRFTYNYKKTPYSDTKLRLSMKFPDLESKDYFISNINYLHEKERVAGTSLSEVFTTQEEDTLLIESSFHWQSAVWKLSLFTFYLKVMSYRTVSDLQAPENRYIEVLTPEVEIKLLAKITGTEAWYNDDLDTNHDYGGFKSLIDNKFKYTKETHNYVFGV